MRDVYDIHYFSKSNWDISHILQGLGELIGGEKEKIWVRSHLKADTVFMLRNYISVAAPW